MKRENPFLNIAFNIIVPVLILQKGSKLDIPHAATWALIIALLMPISYAIYDYRVRKAKNWMSAIGVVNILMTGTLALMSLEGIWFAVKDALFPAILGVGVLASTYTKRPFMATLALNPQVLNVEKIQEHLALRQQQAQFDHHIKSSTRLFAMSFFISAVLNFFLARRIFADIPLELGAHERAQILNDQIAHMTSMSFVVIMVPLLVFSGFVFWHLFSGIQRLTGLKLDDILPSH